MKNGDSVVVKVQRRGIYETKARDIGLLHRAVKLLHPVSLKEMVDFDMVLDELWAVTREEMNFLTEAANMEEFARHNKTVAFVGVPKLYQEYTNQSVLVMEHIEGCSVDDKKHCNGALGNGASDQLQYYLHNRYDTEDMGDSGAWSVWISDCFWDCNVCIFKTYFFEKINVSED